jgi:hypothetical protein
MKFLRAIVEETKRDSIRNTYSRGELKMEEVQNQIERSRLKWFGHVRRMDEHRISESLLKMKMSGRRHGVRTCTRWIDQVKREIERRGGNWRRVDEMQEWAVRDSWRLLCTSQLQMCQQHEEEEKEHAHGYDKCQD